MNNMPHTCNPLCVCFCVCVHVCVLPEGWQQLWSSAAVVVISHFVLMLSWRELWAARQTASIRTFCLADRLEAPLTIPKKHLNLQQRDGRETFQSGDVRTFHKCRKMKLSRKKLSVDVPLKGPSVVLTSFMFSPFRHRMDAAASSLTFHQLWKCPVGCSTIKVVSQPADQTFLSSVNLVKSNSTFPQWWGTTSC